MTDKYEPPARRCENCAHARETNAPDGTALVCDARMLHRTEPHDHCNDWEEARDEA